MRTLLPIVSACLLVTAQAQVSFPPDYYGEQFERTTGFRPNRGQNVGTDGSLLPDVSFYSESGFPRLFMRKGTNMSFVLEDAELDPAQQRAWRRLDMTPVGELVRSVDPMAYVVRGNLENFYLPHCGVNGVTGVVGYSVVVYSDIYPHIDLIFYTTRSGQKMSFVVHPGASPGDIVLLFNGQDNLDVDVFGALRLWMLNKWIALPEAVAYQYTQNNAILPLNWTAHWAPQNNGIVGLTFDTYDPTKDLVLQIGPAPSGSSQYDEPGLCWSTYLGGTNALEGGYESTQDAAGNYYVTGYTNSDFLTFPSVPGWSLSTGGVVAFMLKFDQLDVLAWKDYFGGGTGHAAYGTGIGLRPSGKLYMAGYTNATDLQNAHPGNEYYQGAVVGTDWRAFIGRFDAGTGAREWSTYFGTNHRSLEGLAVCSEQRLFICGNTSSALPPLDVAPPVGSGSYAYSGQNRDGYIAMFNENDQLAWTTCIPGALDNSCSDLDATAAKLVVSGTTESGTLPGMSNSYNGNMDAFIYELSPDCAFQWGAYQGGSGYDSPAENALAIDGLSGDLIMAGYTDGGLSVVPGPGWHQSTTGGAYNGFIVRYASGTHQVLWNTYLHGDVGSAATVEALCTDAIGNLFIAGEFRGSGLEMHTLVGAYDQPAINTDLVNGAQPLARDAFVMCFAPANYLAWSTYFGGFAYGSAVSITEPVAKSGSDGIQTVLFRNNNKNLYVAGHTSKDLDPASYFPLDDGGGIPYFTDTWQGGTNECVMAAFCGQAFTGMNATEMLGPGLRVDASRLGELGLFGLHAGDQICEVFDATGRLLKTARVHAEGNGRAALELPPLSAGAYVLRTTAGSVAFIVE